MGPMRAWGVVATLLFVAFYIALTGELSATESVTMVISVMAGLALAIAIHRSAQRRFALQAPWLRLVTRTFASIGKDSVKVGLFLLRSLWRRPPFPAGITGNQRFRFGNDSAGDTTRRALVVLSVSASPDQYVLEANADDRLLTHSLIGALKKSDQDWPV